MARGLARRVQLPQARALVLGRAQPLPLLQASIDAEMEQAATASGPEATERWRRVEAALAAQAPTVPLTSGSHTALTAERVGNYQHHPPFGPLLDQLWVK